METTQPMATLCIYLPTHHKEILREWAKKRGLVTKTGRPNLSAVGRVVIAEAVEPDQGEETEEGNSDDE